MKFMDKDGALRARYIPLFMGTVALGGFSYGAGLRAGPAFGLFILCSIDFVMLIGFAMIWDLVEGLHARIEEMEGGEG